MVVLCPMGDFRYEIGLLEKEEMINNLQLLKRVYGNL
jgi:hypothetical protein